MAAILRRVYIHKGVGMTTFRRMFGGRDRRGVEQEHRALAASGNIRFCLTQLEKLGMIAKVGARGDRRRCGAGRERVTSPTLSKKRSDPSLSLRSPAERRGGPPHHPEGHARVRHDRGRREAGQGAEVSAVP